MNKVMNEISYDVLRSKQSNKHLKTITDDGRWLSSLLVWDHLKVLSCNYNF